jgi:hypothetical protein
VATRARETARIKAARQVIIIIVTITMQHHE